MTHVGVILLLDSLLHCFQVYWKVDVIVILRHLKNTFLGQNGFLAEREEFGFFVLIMEIIFHSEFYCYCYRSFKVRNYIEP